MSAERADDLMRWRLSVCLAAPGGTPPGAEYLLFCCFAHFVPGVDWELGHTTAERSNRCSQPA